MKKLVNLVLSLTVLVVLSGCSKSTSEVPETTAKVTIVKVGVVGEYNAQWDTVNEILKDENIQVELVKFTAYSIPNEALNSKEIDMNAFQHHIFLKNEIETSGYNLTAIGDTIIAPLAVFNNKEKVTQISDIQDGHIVAIPSDATNGGRALKVLEQMGLIICDPAKGFLPTISDITEYKVKIEILELESAMLASALPDVSIALINGGNAYTAGLKPSTDAIYLEELGENIDGLKNCIVVRTEDENNEIYRKIVEAYQSEAVEKTIAESYEGAFTPAWK